MVLRRLAEGPAIPKQIREDTGQHYSRISEAVKTLRDRGLIDLIVPEDVKQGRIYELTGRGKEVLQFMENRGMLDGGI